MERVLQILAYLTLPVRNVWTNLGIELVVPQSETRVFHDEVLKPLIPKVIEKLIFKKRILEQPVSGSRTGNLLCDFGFF